MLFTLLSRIWSTFRQRRLEEEFDEEVRGHLDMLTDVLSAEVWNQTPLFTLPGNSLEELLE